MDAELLEKESVQAKFRVTVPAPEVDRTFEQVLRTLARQVKVPGFRPGKAPRGVLIQRIGRSSLEEEVRDALVDGSYPKAVRELNLVPVHAHVHADAPQEGNAFSFEVHVDLYPDITLPDLSEIVIDTEAQQVSDDMIGEAVQRLRRDHATLVPVDRTIEPEDFVLVETIAEDGEEGNTLPIDLEQARDAIVEQLLGRKLDDELDLRLEDPAAEAAETPDQAAEEAEGAAPTDRPRVLRVRIVDVKGKEKPEPDDEFAKTLGVDTWAEAEDRIRSSLQAQVDADIFEAQREEFVEKLLAETSFDVPKSLLERRKASLLENLAGDLGNQNLTLEAYLQRLEERGTRASFEQELEESATRGVRRDLVLETLLEARGTTLGEEEFGAALRHLAAREGKTPERFRLEMGQDWLENYRFLLRRDKALREAVRERLGESARPGGGEGDAPPEGEGG